MKKAIFAILETLLFLIVYAAGSLLPGANKLPMWTSIVGDRLFIWDGIVLALAAFVLILLVQLARRTIRTHWITPVGALVLMVILLAATKFPLATITVSR